MKTLFTSMLLMTMMALQAMPVFNDSTNPGKKKEVTSISTPSNPSTVSVQQLQDENALLRAKIASLENVFENEKGILNYKLTMQGLFNKLDEHQKVEKISDLRAEFNFQQAIANALLLLKNQSEQ
jgi:hypothetical protein